MSHPDLDRLTAWVHELLDPHGAIAVEEHVARCAGCGARADRVRREGDVLARALVPSGRLAALKAGLLRRAAEPAARRPGLSWQIPLAAVVLVGLVAALASPGPAHRITAGRVALEDGRELRAPAVLAATKPWSVTAVETVRVRLSDRSTVELTPGTRLTLEVEGERGVAPGLSSGEAVFGVVRDARVLAVRSSAGRVESREGTFRVKTVVADEGGTSMNGMMAGVLVTVFSGSISLSNERGMARVVPGQAAAMSPSEAPLFVASAQDQEALLKRLERLAAAIAKLEQEIARLEERNRQLKKQVQDPNPRGGFYFGGGAAPGSGVRRFVIQKEGAVLQGDGAFVTEDFVVELETKNEKKER
jgi:hypothetical protein